jgi:probable rRNA maturation factor
MANISISSRLGGSLANAYGLDLEIDIPWSKLADAVFELTARPSEAKKEINLSFCEAEEIRHLNKTYRNKDYVTDVLSFEASVEAAFDLSDFEDIAEDLAGDESIYSLGDIVICVSQAGEQAREQDHSLEAELAFLFVHGLLHLLGYDHEEENEAAVMFAIQDQVLAL